VEHGLRVLRGMFRPKRDKVTGGRRKLHNEQFVLFAKNNSNNQVKEDEIVKAYGTNERDQ
jgi:hypothetical protein